MFRLVVLETLTNVRASLPVFWCWKADWVAVGKPPKLLEPLDCPNASKFAKPALAEFCAVNCKWTKHVNGMETKKLKLNQIMAGYTINMPLK